MTSHLQDSVTAEDTWPAPRFSVGEEVRYIDPEPTVTPSWVVVLEVADHKHEARGYRYLVESEDGNAFWVHGDDLRRIGAR